MNTRLKIQILLDCIYIAFLLWVLLELWEVPHRIKANFNKKRTQRLERNNYKRHLRAIKNMKNLN